MFLTRIKKIKVRVGSKDILYQLITLFKPSEAETCGGGAGVRNDVGKGPPGEGRKGAALFVFNARPTPWVSVFVHFCALI